MYQHKLFKILVFAMCSYVLAGCNPSQNISATPEVIPSEVIEYIEYTGVTYRTIDDSDLQLDIALPPDEGGPYPTIVFIFGGGFQEGSRNQYQKQIRWAAERGYVGVTIDHRLNRIIDNKPSNPFPAQVHDVKCAIKWLRTNAEVYNIDTNRIGAVGWSSGGNLALMLALTSESDGLEGTCSELDHSSEIQAAVCIACPIDLTPPSSGSGGKDFQYIEGTPEEMPEKASLASPISYVSENDPPVLSIFGDEDTDVSSSQGELLDSSMKEMGLDHTLIVLEGKDHYKLGVGTRELFASVFEFFDLHLK
jgi:acetyl esterase/lipase